MPENIEKMANKLAKSMYKMAQNKFVAKEIVKDILDPNMDAQVDPNIIPAGKESVIKKSKKIEKKQGVPEEANPEVHERCIKKVKAKGNSKASAYAICNEVGAGVKKFEKSEDFVQNFAKSCEKIIEFYIKNNK